MAERVYLETSVIRYLAARPSRDLVTAALQQITHEWWARRRARFDCFVSDLVTAEAGAGDPAAAAARLQLLRGLPTLEASDEAVDLAQALSIAAGLPVRAAADALHISIAACNGIDYLLTWNSAHIANAEFRPKVERACRSRGYEPPVLCTPGELMGT